MVTHLNVRTLTCGREEFVPDRPLAIADHLILQIAAVSGASDTWIHHWHLHNKFSIEFLADHVLKAGCECLRVLIL